MDCPSSALLWLASGVRHRTVSRFFFNVWYLPDSPAARLIQAQESASLSTCPAELCEGAFCIPPAQYSAAERRAQAASRLAELLSAWRVARVRLLKRFIVHWHGTVLWEQHCRETRELGGGGCAYPRLVHITTRNARAISAHWVGRKHP